MAHEPFTAAVAPAQSFPALICAATELLRRRAAETRGVRGVAPDAVPRRERDVVRGANLVRVHDDVKLRRDRAEPGRGDRVVRFRVRRRVKRREAIGGGFRRRRDGARIRRRQRAHPRRLVVVREVRQHVRVFFSREVPDAAHGDRHRSARDRNRDVPGRVRGVVAPVRPRSHLPMRRRSRARHPGALHGRVVHHPGLVQLELDVESVLVELVHGRRAGRERRRRDVRGDHGAVRGGGESDVRQKRRVFLQIRRVQVGDVRDAVPAVVLCDDVHVVRRRGRELRAVVTERRVRHDAGGGVQRRRGEAGGFRGARPGGGGGQADHRLRDVRVFARDVKHPARARGAHARGVLHQTNLSRGRRGRALGEDDVIHEPDLVQRRHDVESIALDVLHRARLKRRRRDVRGANANPRSQCRLEVRDVLEILRDGVHVVVAFGDQSGKLFDLFHRFRRRRRRADVAVRERFFAHLIRPGFDLRRARRDDDAVRGVEVIHGVVHDPDLVEQDFEVERSAVDVVDFRVRRREAGRGHVQRLDVNLHRSRERVVRRKRVASQRVVRDVVRDDDVHVVLGLVAQTGDVAHVRNVRGRDLEIRRRGVVTARGPHRGGEGVRDDLR
eukprot:8302-Pelagococcus_subviridis.AAC.1